jgi:hypothetical protein
MHPLSFSLFRLPAGQRKRAEIFEPLPCCIATRLGAPVALQQSRILPVSFYILPF